jgi:hypothetical protein
VLGEIDQMRADLQLHVRDRPHWTGQLRRQLTAAAIQGSNTIEKITIGMSDARAAVEGQPMSVDVADNTQLAILGYRDALTYVQQTPHIAGFEYHRSLLFGAAFHDRQIRHVEVARPLPQRRDLRDRLRVYLIDGVARDAHLAAMDAVRRPMREPYRR